MLLITLKLRATKRLEFHKIGSFINPWIRKEIDCSNRLVR